MPAPTRTNAAALDLPQTTEQKNTTNPKHLHATRQTIEKTRKMLVFSGIYTNTGTSRVR
jgi:hypothetical protein